MLSAKPFAIMVFGLFVAAFGAHAGLDRPEKPRWKPVADDVYLQDSSVIVPTGKPILAVAVFQGALFTGDDVGIARLHGETLQPVEGSLGPVTRLKVLKDAL